MVQKCCLDLKVSDYENKYSSVIIYRICCKIKFLGLNLFILLLRMIMCFELTHTQTKAISGQKKDSEKLSISFIMFYFFM